jgi:hypothetical protein
MSRRNSLGEELGPAPFDDRSYDDRQLASPYPAQPDTLPMDRALSLLDESRKTEEKDHARLDGLMSEHQQAAALTNESHSTAWGVAYALACAVAFGFWKESIAAGVFMFFLAAIAAHWVLRDR